MVYDIVFEPEEILHQKSADIDASQINTRPFQKLIKDMVETMYVKDGVGLAGVQIGKSLQICVIAKNYNTATLNEDLCLINPTWEPLKKDKELDEEGCLSVPGKYGKIERYTNIKVKALDKKGRPLEFIATDFFARIVQHELDHLAGHLYIEKASDIRDSGKTKVSSKYPRN